MLGNMRMDRICRIRNRMKKLLIKQKIKEHLKDESWKKGSIFQRIRK